VLAEDVDDARLRQYGQLTHYLTGHQMEPARPLVALLAKNFVFCVVGAVTVLWIWKKLFD
jgi:uncharacterized membrane protein YeaQ/YmgE (transglycosylase-associated protein family)